MADNGGKMYFAKIHIARVRKLMAACVSTAAIVTNPTIAFAGSASTTMPVSATVLSACAVVATPMIFGNYSGAQTDGQATLLVVCTPLEDFDIALDDGADPSATVADRSMLFLTNQLHYNLYTDASRGTIWGDGTLGTSTVPGVGSGILTTVDVYGRIPADQFVPPGLYVDLVTVSMTF